MKKFFTLIVMCVMAVAANANIKIYVQSETAPFVWWWGAAVAEGTDAFGDPEGDWPGTYQLTEEYTHPDTGDKFWVWSLPENVTSISFLFNNGDKDKTRQTTDIKSVTTDRYFILGAWPEADEKITAEDVTADYSDVEIPDAEITSMGLSGNHNGWGSDLGEGVTVETVEAGKIYKVIVDTKDFTNKAWEFKFRPNGEWAGVSNIAYDGEQPAWLGGTDNFAIDLNTAGYSVFTFTLTWGGGKLPGENWSMKAEASGATDIVVVPDAEITSMGLSGNHNGWGDELGDGVTIETVEAGKTYKVTVDTKDFAEKAWQFKFRPNGEWAGVSNIAYDGEQPAWLGGTDNFAIDLETAGFSVFTFTLTWGGGKKAGENWTMKAEATGATGISTVKFFNATTNALYNLQGQRVQAGFRGIAIKNGRKFMVK